MNGVIDWSHDVRIVFNKEGRIVRIEPIPTDNPKSKARETK